MTLAAVETPPNARVYNPNTGRFLTTDPIPGGNPNPYTYPVDPINNYDLTGTFSFGNFISSVVQAVTYPVQTIRAVVHVVQQAYHAAARVVKRVYHAVATAVRSAATYVKAHATRQNISRLTAVVAVGSSAAVASGLLGDEGGAAAGLIVGEAAGAASTYLDFTDPNLHGTAKASIVAGDIAADLLGFGAIAADYRASRLAGIEAQRALTTRDGLSAGASVAGIPGTARSLGGGGGW